MASVSSPHSVASHAIASQHTARLAKLAQSNPSSVKAQTSATPEELQAAINGTLTARNPVVAAPTGARPLGITSGLPILMHWILLFQQNEARPADKKWSDAEIASMMKREFPNRQNGTFDAVHAARLYCNKGAATRGVQPKKQFTQFIAPPRKARSAPMSIAEMEKAVAEAKAAKIAK